MEAVTRHNAGRYEAAEGLFRAADRPEIGEWFTTVVGSFKVHIHGRLPVVLDPPVLPISERKKPRMPGAETKRAILARDGFHCRFCEMPVMHKGTILRIASAYPDSARWTDVAANQHRFFQAANLQYDHIVPHSRGGESSVENMVIACAVCNYGRMSYMLDEMNLLDPRAHATRQSAWDGLQGFLER